MNWDAIGAVGEILGAIAVFASLTYLAIQIRVTSRQFQAQLDDNLASKIFEAYDPFYEGRNAEIMYHGLSEPGALSGVDAFTFDLLMRRHCGVVAHIAQAASIGELDEESVAAYIVHYRKVFFTKPGGKQWLAENPEAMQGAITFFNDLIEENP